MSTVPPAQEPTVAWLRTSGCRTSYLAGRAAGQTAASVNELPDEIAEDVVRILRSVPRPVSPPH